jgi:hypothetical protein
LRINFRTVRSRPSPAIGNLAAHSARLQTVSGAVAIVMALIGQINVSR